MWRFVTYPDMLDLFILVEEEWSYVGAFLVPRYTLTFQPLLACSSITCRFWGPRHKFWWLSLYECEIFTPSVNSNSLRQFSASRKWYNMTAAKWIPSLIKVELNLTKRLYIFLPHIAVIICTAHHSMSSLSSSGTTNGQHSRQSLSSSSEMSVRVSSFSLSLPVECPLKTKKKRKLPVSKNCSWH